jgi:hypothetical protein
MSAQLADIRLTTLGRTAVPLTGQSMTQQVVDAADCRENIQDSQLYVGGYTLFNPLRFHSTEEALHDRELRLARCLRERGYGVFDPPPRRPAGG